MTALFLMMTLAAPDAEAMQPPAGRAEASYQRGLETRENGVIARGHFEQSAQAYDEVWESSPPSLGVARYRANAWLLTGDIGRAMRAYRQGLRSFPEDSVLHAGYEYARQQVTLPKVAEIADACKPLPIQKSWSAFTAEQVFWGILAVNGAGWLVLIYGITRGRWSSPFTGVIMIALSWIGLNAWESTTNARSQFWAQSVVVITKPTTLHTGNNAEFPKRFAEALPAGVEAEPLEERGGWIRVRFRGEVTGWLPLSDVVRS